MSLCVSMHRSMKTCREPELCLLLLSYCSLDLLFDREDGSIAFLRNVSEHGIRQYSSVQGQIERIKEQNERRKRETKPR